MLEMSTINRQTQMKSTSEVGECGQTHVSTHVAHLGDDCLPEIGHGGGRVGIHLRLQITTKPQV